MLSFFSSTKNYIIMAKVNVLSTLVTGDRAVDSDYFSQLLFLLHRLVNVTIIMFACTNNKFLYKFLSFILRKTKFQLSHYLISFPFTCTCSFQLVQVTSL